MRIGSHDLATRAKRRRMAANLGRHVSQSKYLFNIILLLSNDIHLNPGPSNPSDTGDPLPITFNTNSLKVAH